MQTIRKLILLIFLLAITQFLKCQQKTCTIILGNWEQINGSLFKRCFSSNGTFKEYIGGAESISKYNKYNKSNRYKVIVKSDTVWLYLTYSNLMTNQKVRKKTTKHYALKVEDNYLTMISYKEAKGKYDHVDEYSTWKREGVIPSYKTENRTHIKFIFPEAFKGAAWIAFNQPNGVPPIYDSLGNAILKIPENGLLLTSLHEDVFATANKNYEILEEHNQNRILGTYRTFDKFDKFDSTCCKLNEFIAVMCGFNQEGREDIDKFFGKSINKNVMTIYIGKYNWFEQNWLHPWDSKME